MGKGSWPKLGKMIDLTANLEKFTTRKHNKGSKIYPQIQVIFRLYNANHATKEQVFKYHFDMGHCLS